MSASPRDNYLAMQVRTASPQKLQLMLIEAALRDAERTRQLWASKDDHEAVESLIHAQEIAGQLVGAIDRQMSDELVQNAAAVYTFIYRCLVEAGHGQDVKKLADAIRVLQIERDTWRQLCETMASAEESHFRTDAAECPTPTALPLADGCDIEFSGGLSIEA